MLRIGLFLLTNLAVMAVIGLLITALGLNQPGMGWAPLVVMAGLLGMGGALVSLLLSKRMAVRSAQARVIDLPQSETEHWLLDTVKSHAARAGLGMPDVAVFPSSAPNAFATGASRNQALVAVSTGLLERMNREEIEAVLGHEVSHVANGDMVTLSLLQGVVNTFVMVFAQIVSSLVDRRGGNRAYNMTGYGFGRGFGYRTTYVVTQAVLGFIATLVVRWFSRWREFRADAGGARLAGRDRMISALQRLLELQRPAQLPAELQAMGINGGLLGAIGLKKLTMTHPPLEERIAALRRLAP